MPDFAPKHFYHIADISNLPSIHEHGLLSTEQLIKLAGICNPEFERLLTTHRPESLVLPNGIVIRDQSPMPPEALERALPKNISPSEWYRLLNGFVFLWPNIERLTRHKNACRPDTQVLMVFDATRLLDELGDRILLSPINSGNARRKPSPRSRETLVPYKTWMAEGWPALEGQTIRSPSFKPAEILIKDKLPLEPYLLEVSYL